jgi:ATP-binding cassette subfamily B protein
MNSSFRATAASLGERWRKWAMLARMLPAAGPVALTAGLLIAVVRGLLPVAFILAIGHVLRTLHTDGRPATTGVGALGLAVVAFGLQQLLAPVQSAIVQLVGRRIDGAGIRRMMSAAIRSPLERIEQQATIGSLINTTVNYLYIGLTPGKGAAALLNLLTRYIELISALVVVGVFIYWPVAGILALSALILRFAGRGALARFSLLWNGLNGNRQSLFYLQVIGTHDESAKEMRALRLAPWLKAFHHRETTEYLRPLWRGRRKIYLRPYLVYSALGLLFAAIAFAAIAYRTTGTAEVLGLAVAIQAVLVPMRFGAHIPEADNETQYGINSARDLEGLHAELGRPRDDGVGRERLTLTRPPEVRFDAVGFAYPGADRPVLQELDLTLAPGSSTAVVGINGAGKTTLVKQLCGLYRPDRGLITVNGTDLRSLDLADWRRHVAVILQDFGQYEMSLRDNIAFGAPHVPVDDDAVLDALERASATDILTALPKGLATILSPAYEGGVGLSGGQWQRLALARALYSVSKGARLLVLDEPTAQLDVRSELAFFDQFMELTSGLTTLVISHRFSTVRHADNIAVLADGRVAEYGSHESLIDLDGSYAEMFHLQADRFADSDEVTA